MLLTRPCGAFSLFNICWHGRPANRAKPAVTSNEPDCKYYLESNRHLLYIFVFSALSLQDPAGIFELVEVVGNGTYGQVYKVGLSLHLCIRIKDNRRVEPAAQFLDLSQRFITLIRTIFSTRSGLVYLLASTDFSDANIIPVHLFWSWVPPTSIISRLHPI